ncbi:hypothetical protein [Adhaeribacter aquaticus]|uniref:hypothetical protein n=1 Tax=Adhaeribacter aquaticus TaxID=299567 RepID=UPI0004196DA7|nr:hypothetical protein [Adhaeribacter aquaticus]
MNQAQVDFQQLRIKHILFKSKVRSVLYGGSYDAEFFSPNGPINIWFNAIGLSRYRNETEMRELIQVQQELNATANLLFNLYKSGKIEQAHDGLNKIDLLSERFTKILSALEGKLAA